MENFDEMKKRYADELMRVSPSNNTSTQNSSPRTPATQQTTDIRNVDNPDETGFMQVRVSALRESVPVVGATVVVSKPIGEESSVMWSDVTDESGKSGVIELPTPSKSLSESPQAVGVVPYSVYNVKVSAQGFYTVYSINAQVFPGQLSIVAVDMVPKKETEMFNENDITFITPPSNLLDT